MRDACDVEDRVLVRHGVEARVIAKRPFRPQLAEVHIALENVLRVRRHLEIDRLALHQLHRLAAQKSRNQVLLDIGRRGHNRRKRRRRIGPNRHSDLHPPSINFAQRRRRNRRRARRRSRTASGLRHQLHARSQIVRITRTRASLSSRAQAVAQVFRRVLLPLPVHPRRLPVVHLHAVHAHVALARLRIARDDTRQRNERPAVLRPCRQHRQLP